MESLSMSLKYILDSTKAYKNGFITKSEYKESRTFDILIIGLLIAKSKDMIDIFLKSVMFRMTLTQMYVILSQPKPKSERQVK